MANTKKDNQSMDFPLQISRQYPAPLDKHSVFYSMEDAQDYATNSPLAYVGQTISVLNETDQTVDIYKIGFNGQLLGLGGEVDTSNFVQKSGDTMTGPLTINKKLVIDHSAYTPSYGQGEIVAREIHAIGLENTTCIYAPAFSLTTHANHEGDVQNIVTVTPSSNDIMTASIYIDGGQVWNLNPDQEIRCSKPIYIEGGLYDVASNGIEYRVYSPLNLPTPEIIGAEPAITKNTAFNKNFGTMEGTVCEGNDSRLSNARTPTYHASSATTYGVGTTTVHGHVMLSNVKTVNSTSNSKPSSVTGAALAYSYHVPGSSGINLNNYRSPGQFTIHFSNSSHNHTNFPSAWNTQLDYYLEVKNAYGVDQSVIQVLYCGSYAYAYIRYSTSSTSWSSWTKFGEVSSSGINALYFTKLEYGTASEVYLITKDSYNSASTLLSGLRYLPIQATGYYTYDNKHYIVYAIAKRSTSNFDLYCYDTDNKTTVLQSMTASSFTASSQPMYA